MPKNQLFYAPLHGHIDIKNGLYAFSWLATIAIIILAQTYPTLFQEKLAIPITLSLVLFIGIPHGAIDHILYYQSCRRRLSEASASPAKSASKTSEMKQAFTWRWLFYWNYLLIMAIWTILWTFTPVIAFWVFMVVSAYHFGESDLDYLQVQGPFKYALYLSKGLFLVGQVAATDVPITFPIISKLLCDPQISWLIQHGQTIRFASITQHFAMLLMLALMDFSIKKEQAKASKPAYPVWSRTIGAFSLAREFIQSFLMLIVFYYLGSLTGFSIYFGLWHALRATIHQIGFLAGEQAEEFVGDSGHEEQHADGKEPIVTMASLWRFTRLSFNFTFISIAGMLILYWRSSHLQQIYEENGLAALTEVWAVFVMCISVLTGPHMWIIYSLHDSTSCMDPFFGRTMADKMAAYMENSPVGKALLPHILHYL